jgi:hypothetical protein
LALGSWNLVISGRAFVKRLFRPIRIRNIMEQLRIGLILLGVGERQGHPIERRRHMPR